MILSGDEIRSRLDEIFKPETHDDTGIKEASYVLRVAGDGLMFEGKIFELDTNKPATSIEINPGKIAVLSTKEHLTMPDCLVGKIGIRLRYALQGLTGLMGIQVDPCYGQNTPGGERLYIRVANLGINPIILFPGERVFTFELHQLKTPVKCEQFQSRESTWQVLKRDLPRGEEASWSYASRIDDRTVRRERAYQRRFDQQIAGIRDYLQPIVMFGIFLVAVSILGVMLTVTLNFSEPDKDNLPPWVPGWGWIIILATISSATLATAIFGGLACFRLAKDTWGNRHNDIDEDEDQTGRILGDS